jgi:ribosomal protein S30
MSKVLNITGRIDHKKKKQQVKMNRNKLEVVQRLVQCSSCRLRCPMCGKHLESNDSSCPSTSPLPDLNLCEGCNAELKDYLEMSRGNKGPNVVWHNKEWMEVWTSWLEYQEALRAFQNSPEFKVLPTLLMTDD